MAESFYQAFGDWVATPDACYAPSQDSDVNLMRQEAQNDRQLRFALKLYRQTQKEDAARPGGEGEQADDLLEALERSLDKGVKGEAGKGENGQAPASAAGISNIFDENQSHQVVENTGEVSGNGQNNPNFGHSRAGTGTDRGRGEEGKREDSHPIATGPNATDHQSTVCNQQWEASAIPTPESRSPDTARLMVAARPRVKELLEHSLMTRSCARSAP